MTNRKWDETSSLNSTNNCYTNLNRLITKILLTCLKTFTFCSHKKFVYNITQSINTTVMNCKCDFIPPPYFFSQKCTNIIGKHLVYDYRKLLSVENNFI